MTVAELIIELQKCPQGIPAVLRGYESGVDEVNRLSVRHMKRGQCGGEGIKYSGDHDLIDEDDHAFDGVEGEWCLYLYHECE